MFFRLILCQLLHLLLFPEFWGGGVDLQAINAGEGVEKREPSYTVGGNAN